MERCFVTGTPARPERGDFQGPTIAACIDWIRRRWDRGRGKPAIWVDPLPSGDRIEGYVCLPVRDLDSWRDHAERLVDAWEARWLLVQSAPPQHRDDAREELLDAITAALALTSRSAASGEASDVGF